MFWLTLLSYALGVFVAVLHGRHLLGIFRLYRAQFTLAKRPTTRESFADLMDFAKAYHDFSPSLNERVKLLKDDFLREAVTAFLHGGVVGHELLRSLRVKADRKFESDSSVLQEIQLRMRSFPAVGWAVAIGASIWMFNTGGEPVTIERSAAAFAFSMAAVVYGLLLTYLVAMPLMEKVWFAAKSEREKNVLLIEGLALIVRKKSPYELYENLQILLPEKDQSDWRQVFSGPQLKAG